MFFSATTIPSDGISYEEALERLFDARSDAADLRTEIARPVEDEDDLVCWPYPPEPDEAWLRLEQARAQAREEVKQFLWEALACGALTGYWEAPHGPSSPPFTPRERLKILPSYWLMSADERGYRDFVGDHASVFFLKTDFERWINGGVLPKKKGSPDLDRLLGESTRRTKRPRTRADRDRAGRAVRAIFPDGVPDPVDLPNADLVKRVADRLKHQNKPSVSPDTILRAASRRK